MGSAALTTAPRRVPGMAVALVLAVMLAVLVVAAWAQVPIRFNARAGWDEALFLRQAQALAEGHWLGAYDLATLAKGSGLALWLAAVHHLAVPVALAAACLQLCACAVLVLALRPVLPEPAAQLALFACVLLGPATLGDLGLMRELIYPALVLIAVAGSLGLALRSHAAHRLSVRWAAVMGLGTSAAWLVREEGAWLLLAWLACAAAVMLQVSGQGRRLVPRALAVAAVAIATAAAPLVLVATLNRQHYGVFTLLEFTARPFTAAYGALLRVQAPRAALPHVPLPRSAWPAVAAASPAFAQLRQQLEGDVGRPWQGPSVEMLGPLIEQDVSIRAWLAEQLEVPIDQPVTGQGVASLRQRYTSDPAFRAGLERYIGGARVAANFMSGAMRQEIGAAWFPWALREAAAAAGHHGSARHARDFYANLAREVNDVCDRGALACDAARVGLAPPMTATLLAAWPAAFAQTGWALLSLKNVSTRAELGDLGAPTALAAASQFLHQRLAAPKAVTPAVPVLEALFGFWRLALPPLALAALLLWLLIPVWWRRHRDVTCRTAQRAIWLAAGVLLALVLARVALIAWIHVSSWPAALTARYLSPAQPLLGAFVALVAIATWRTVVRPGGRRD